MIERDESMTTKWQIDGLNAKPVKRNGPFWYILFGIVGSIFILTILRYVYIKYCKNLRPCTWCSKKAQPHTIRFYSNKSTLMMNGENLEIEPNKSYTWKSN